MRIDLIKTDIPKVSSLSGFWYIGFKYHMATCAAVSYILYENYNKSSNVS